MTDRPILFSGPMVRSIIAECKKPGTGKTQTRRVLKAEVPPMPSDEVVHRAKHERPYLDAYAKSPMWCWWTRDDRCCLPQFDVGYAVGDSLWVRETCAFECCQEVGWYDPPYHDGRPLKVTDCPEWGRYWHQPHYRATDPMPELDIGREDGEPGVRWRPAIHMPRWASRLTLSVTDVRVQRLQDISKDDVIAEGIKDREGHPLSEVVAGWHEPFAQLWDSINGKKPGRSWKDDPWVVAVSFRPELRNIDAPVREIAA